MIVTGVMASNRKNGPADQIPKLLHGAVTLVENLVGTGQEKN